ncbi:hypothetical protein [Streptomyces sp. NPDC059452]|uniref:hypothetical protein n=1 Tax=Streptomyces sp. NPDC059452 TaxID=3346835 RepID=UPI0036CA2C51
MRAISGRGASAARLLPWTGTGGKPCYLVGGGTGYVSRMADQAEEVQLDMAYELLGHTDGLLTEPGVTAPELHFLASRLSECLGQVHRIAESRGRRLEAVLPQPDEAVPPQSDSEISP